MAREVAQYSFIHGEKEAEDIVIFEESRAVAKVLPTCFV